MKARSTEYLDAGRRRLGSARRLAGDDPTTALSRRFVIEWPIDSALATQLQRLQADREEADYDAVEVAPDDAGAAIAAADRFITAVAAMLERPGPT